MYHKIIIENREQYKKLLGDAKKLRFDTPKELENLPYALIVNRQRKFVRNQTKEKYKKDDYYLSYYPTAKETDRIAKKEYKAESKVIIPVIDPRSLIDKLGKENIIFSYR